MGRAAFVQVYSQRKKRTLRMVHRVVAASMVATGVRALAARMPTKAFFINVTPCVSGNRLTIFRRKADMTSSGSVVPEITREGDFLHLRVTDDGEGLTEEALAALREHLTQKDAFGEQSVGLINVSRRIQLLYGKNSGLRIQSRVGCGTEVDILLEMNPMLGKPQEREWGAF